MPVITPAYPCMNSTYNVSESTLQILKQEFARGREITFRIEHNGTHSRPEEGIISVNKYSILIGILGESWKTLFDKAEFFSKYKIFVQIDMFADTEENHRKWYLSFPRFNQNTFEIVDTFFFCVFKGWVGRIQIAFSYQEIGTNAVCQACAPTHLLFLHY